MYVLLLLLPDLYFILVNCFNKQKKYENDKEMY